MADLNAINIYHISKSSGQPISMSETAVKVILGHSTGTTENITLDRNPGPAGTTWSDLVSVTQVLRATSVDYKYFRAKAIIPESAGYSHWTVRTSTAGGSRYSSDSKSVNIYGIDTSGDALYNQGDAWTVYQQWIQDETGSDHFYYEKGYVNAEVYFKNNYSSSTEICKSRTIQYDDVGEINW